jgi:hypothetical protein
VPLSAFVFRPIYGQDEPMRDTVAPRQLSRPLMVAAAAIIIVLAGTLWLWAHYGAAVFFETIRAGFVACFG